MTSTVNIPFDNSFSQLPEQFYTRQAPVPVAAPKLIKVNEGLATLMGIDPVALKSDDGVQMLAGNSVPDGASPLAMVYAGHQFGGWSPRLGDGRAILLGETVGTDGIRRDIHLKGSGRTPYSRGGDGRAWLGPVLREYVISEAMAALDVPTTRPLSVVATGENIIRNGQEPAAIVCRTARSHLRVGTFQIAAASCAIESLRALADFAIDRLYSDAPKTGPERYAYFLRQVIAGQADLISKWMGYGFIHGVMNTDNACISGETIDYGPCAFMDDFHPGKVFSSIDRNGRYAWNRQPEIAQWNMVRLAETLLPLLGDTEEQQQAAAEAQLATFSPLFAERFNDVMAKKFGLPNGDALKPEFLAETFETMTTGQVDFTLFFRHLTLVAGGGETGDFVSLFNDKTFGTTWLNNWKMQTGFAKQLNTEQLVQMRGANPIIIPRNHRIEEAIADANAGNLETFKRLFKAVTTPFEERAEYDAYENPPKVDEVVWQTFCGT